MCLPSGVNALLLAASYISPGVYLAPWCEQRQSEEELGEDFYSPGCNSIYRKEGVYSYIEKKITCLRPMDGTNFSTCPEA